jgi:signal transduction histidine kinase
MLVRAWESQNLVLVSGVEGGEVRSAFALPLTSAHRCLGFLAGNRRGIGSPDEGEAAALETVGLVAASLLDNALARQEAQQLDVLKSEFIALAAHELRNPLSSIYGLSSPWTSAARHSPSRTAWPCGTRFANRR